MITCDKLMCIHDSIQVYIMLCHTFSANVGHYMYMDVIEAYRGLDRVRFYFYFLMFNVQCSISMFSQPFL